MKRYFYFYSLGMDIYPFFSGMYGLKSQAESDRRAAIEEGCRVTKIVSLKVPKFQKRKAQP